VSFSENKERADQRSARGRAGRRLSLRAFSVAACSNCVMLASSELRASADAVSAQRSGHGIVGWRDLHTPVVLSPAPPQPLHSSTGNRAADHLLSATHATPRLPELSTGALRAAVGATALTSSPSLTPATATAWRGAVQCGDDEGGWRGGRGGRALTDARLRTSCRRASCRLWSSNAPLSS